MRAVAIGSSAEHGSSISTTSGSTASARAMHKRCCCPPDSERPLCFSLSFTSSQSAARVSACSTMSDISERLRPLIFGPYATLSKMVFGNGLGFWNTMPIRRRTSAASTFDPYRLSPWYITDPSTCAPGVMSCMRLRQRSTVVLPHPDGPMNAVISFAAMSRSTSRIAVWPLYFTSTSLSSKHELAGRLLLGARLLGFRLVGFGQRDLEIDRLHVRLFGRHRRHVSTVVARSSSVRMGSSKGSGRLAAAEERVHDPGQNREHEHDENERERAPHARSWAVGNSDRRSRRSPTTAWS